MSGVLALSVGMASKLLIDFGQVTSPLCVSGIVLDTPLRPLLALSKNVTMLEGHSS